MTEQEPDDVAQDLHEPDHRAGEADLLVADEVRDVALERPAGDVRAERQQRGEGREHQDGVGGGDPEQEHEVEQRAEDDVRLAATPAADRVVADRADRRLDEDRDDADRDRDQEERPPDLEIWHGHRPEVEPVLDEQPDRAVDRGQAQPVQRDADQVAGRQLPRRPPDVHALGARRDGHATTPSPRSRHRTPPQGNYDAGTAAPVRSSATPCITRTSPRSVASGATKLNSDRSSE